MSEQYTETYKVKEKVVKPKEEKKEETLKPDLEKKDEKVEQQESKDSE